MRKLAALVLAALTPALACLWCAPVAAAPPPDRPGPAYQLRFEIDVPVLTIAAAFVVGRGLRGSLAPAYCAPSDCDRATVNWLDRPVAGRYHPAWETWSDVGVYGLQALAVTGLLVHEGLRAGLNDLVVVAEATLLANAAAGLSASAFGRPRPFMYGTEAPVSVRASGNGGLSYFSAHTATSFGVATATFVTLHRLHPGARWPWWVLAGGATAAGFVGATRILAGQHFPTDVVTGAFVGTAAGLLVPALHAAPGGVRAVPMAMASGGGVALVGMLP